MLLKAFVVHVSSGFLEYEMDAIGHLLIYAMARESVMPSVICLHEIFSAKYPKFVFHVTLVKLH